MKSETGNLKISFYNPALHKTALVACSREPADRRFLEHAAYAIEVSQNGRGVAELLSGGVTRVCISG